MDAMADGEPDDGTVTLDRADVVALCRAALRAAGAGPLQAELLVETALYAEDRGHPEVGVAHLLDHVHALDDGRLDGRAVPRVHRASPVVTLSDARGGIAQTGFHEGAPDLVLAAQRYGLAAFAQRRAFTCGALGWFVDRLAGAGLVAVATAVAPAVLAAGPGSGPVFGTNPMAYSVPRPGRPPLTVDQASSSTAYVSVRAAAERGTPLPEGWALDADGRPTTDPRAALDGALLPFGGYKGANIALLVELLSSIAGGNWSMDAPPWDAGSRSPEVGMFVLAIDPDVLGRGSPARIAEHLDRLADSGVRLPRARPAEPGSRLALRADVVNALRRRSTG
jgi:(2R)-3-sulfolactate dehydrogenase (NADP+)